MDTEKTAADLNALGKQRGYGTPESAKAILAARARKAGAALDLEALKASAREATPGAIYSGDKELLANVTRQNAEAFHAAASPAAVLALIELLGGKL